MTNPIIPPPEKILIPHDKDEVCCDGGGGALGHPRVWYNLAEQSSVECGYCDRAFIRAGR